MTAAYKPEGYSTVSPYLVVGKANDTIRFLVNVLDAVEIRRFAGEDGSVMHAEVRVDDTVIMLGEGPPPIEALVHVYVPDVDATYKRALEAGGTSVQEPVKGQDADKRGGVKDPGGTTWWFATMVG